MSVLLYGAETWTLTEQEWLKLQSFHYNCHSLSAPYSGCQVVWLCHNESICITTGLADIRDIVWRRRLGLFGRVVRCDHDVPAASVLAVLRLQRLHTTRVDVEATSGASTTLMATSSLQGHWHVGHWCSDTGTGPRFVESSCYGLRARRTMMMMMMMMNSHARDRVDQW